MPTANVAELHDAFESGDGSTRDSLTDDSESSILPRMTSTWSEAFKAYISRRWRLHAQKEASFSLRVTPSAIHYWCRGARPRDEKVRARIQRWSGGAVNADLPASADLPRSA